MESPAAYFDSVVNKADAKANHGDTRQPQDDGPTSLPPSSPTKKDLSSPLSSMASKAGSEDESGEQRLPYNYTRIWGLGTLNRFPDWLIMKIMRLLDAEDLVQLSLVSRALYIYSDENDLWKDLCIRKHSGDFRSPSFPLKIYSYFFLKENK